MGKPRSGRGVSLARCIGELAYAFGWTHDYILSLTVPLVSMYLRELGAIRQDENLMRLAIATNPHIEGKKQKDLWNSLQKKPARPKPQRSIGDYEAEKEKLSEYLGRTKRV